MASAPPFPNGSAQLSLGCPPMWNRGKLLGRRASYRRRFLKVLWRKRGINASACCNLATVAKILDEDATRTPSFARELGAPSASRVRPVSRCPIAPRRSERAQPQACAFKGRLDACVVEAEDQALTQHDDEQAHDAAEHHVSQKVAPEDHAHPAQAHGDHGGARERERPDRRRRDARRREQPSE